MRFVLAIICFVLAAGSIGYGIAQRTIFLEPDEVTLSTELSTGTAVTVIDGAALNAYDGAQTLSLSGSPSIFAAYGRTADIVGWIGDAEYTQVSVDAATGDLTNELVPGTESEVPAPSGSDLWLQEYVQENTLTTRVNVPDDISFIVVSDGIAPAPDTVQVTWPVDNSTPWSGPLIIAGAVALLLGLAFLLWALGHMRSSRGPRRKPQKMPKVPRKPLYKSGRKAIGRSTAGFVALPVLVVGTLLLTGCTDPGIQAPLPTPSASEAEAEPGDPPAVTVSQVERIVANVSEVTAAADAAKDSALLSSRFDGAALQLRTANYAITTADGAIPALAGIPDGPLQVTLPQRTETWPRTVFTVVYDEADVTTAPLALFLVQASARENYKVAYAITLEPSAVLPDVASATVGTSRLTDDSPVLRLSPTELALNYADILERDVDSPAYLDFEAEGDSLRANVGLAYKNNVRAALPATASVSFGHSMGEAEAIILATNDAGALIAVNLNEITTVQPIEEGAAVNPSGQVKALSGLAVSTKGVVATYGDQLLFSVPKAGGDGKIVLLGYTQGLISAGELP